MGHADDEDTNAPPRGVRARYRHAFSCVLQPAAGHGTKPCLSIQSHDKDNRYAVLILGGVKIVVLRQELIQRINDLELCAD